MEVVSFRIPRSLKTKMKHMHTNWSSEVRKMIEDKVKRQRSRKALEDAVTMLSKTPSAPRGTAARYIREDRDSR